MFIQKSIWYNVTEKVPFTAFKQHIEVRHMNGKKNEISEVMEDIWQSGRMFVKLVNSSNAIFACYYFDKKRNKGWWATESVIQSGIRLNVEKWSTFEERNNGVIPK